MTAEVSNEAKRDFVLWFLYNHTLQKEGAEEILLYLISTAQTLARLHFMDNFSDQEPAMLVSAVGSMMPPFLFKKTKKVTTSPAEALVRLIESPNDEIYVTLYFENRNYSQRFYEVVETDPAVEPEPGSPNAVDKLVVEEFLHRAQAAYVYNLIDLALQDRDEKKFKELVSELKGLGG